MENQPNKKIEIETVTHEQEIIWVKVPVAKSNLHAAQIYAIILDTDPSTVLGDVVKKAMTEI